MIICKDAQFGKTVNDLAREGKISPVWITVNGQRLQANSVWAATEWLKENGHYEQRSTVIWEGI